MWLQRYTHPGLFDLGNGIPRFMALEHRQRARWRLAQLVAAILRCDVAIRGPALLRRALGVDHGRRRPSSPSLTRDSAFAGLPVLSPAGVSSHLQSAGVHGRHMHSFPSVRLQASLSPFEAPASLIESGAPTANRQTVSKVVGALMRVPEGMRIEALYSFVGGFPMIRSRAELASISDTLVAAAAAGGQ